LVHHAKRHFAQSAQEEVWVACLNPQGHLLATFCLDKGEGHVAEFSARKLLQAVLSVNTQTVLLMHNHLAMDSRPSPPDIATTKTVKDILDLLGIVLLDHLIVDEAGRANLIWGRFDLNNGEWKGDVK
jgi:DNA repair protein RadC